MTAVEVLLASRPLSDRNTINAGYRRWTARKGWREQDPQRGLFILEFPISVLLRGGDFFKLDN